MNVSPKALEQRKQAALASGAARRSRAASCSDCGTGVTGWRKRCPPCAVAAARARARAYNARRSAFTPVAACLDCGTTFAKTGFAHKRCGECAGIRAKRKRGGRIIGDALPPCAICRKARTLTHSGGVSAFCAECRQLVALSAARERSRTLRSGRPLLAKAYKAVASSRRRASGYDSGHHGGFTSAEVYGLWKEWDYHCAYCGARRSKETKLTCDHIVPLNLGGPNTLANLAPACLGCNSSKQDSDMLEWSARRYFVVHPRILAQYQAIMEARCP